jgi:Sulfatase-modifying factor enzyme 1
VGLPATARRVVRGGSWNNAQDHVRASYRNDNAPDNRNNNVGLRVVRSSHILIPLMAQPGGCLRIRLLRACSPAWLARAGLPVLAADYGWRPEAKAIKMAQMSPARTGSA